MPRLPGARSGCVLFLSVALALDLLGCQGAPAIVATPAGTPAAESGGAKHAIVASANPLATETGLAILHAGGSAADAAVAMQAVLGLVEPQSSGLGGGAFISYYDAGSRRVTAYNGRETAPASAGPDLFLDSGGRPLPFFTAVLSGRSTGVPGAVAALALVQHEHGRLPWQSLFGRAQALARDGFRVSPRLAGMIAGRAPQAAAPDARHYFTKADGSLYVAGDLLRNPAYADTVQRLALEGPDALYRGSIARDIVQRVHEGEWSGALALEDLAQYRALESPALCRPWRQYVVCGPPPPAGGVSVLEGLLLLEHTDIARRGPTDPLAWVELGAAERLLYADRNRYLGDPGFVSVPTQGLLDPDYLRGRAALIGARIDPTPPDAGVPPGAPHPGADHTVEPGGTSHIVIVDAAGNALSMTTTVESIFGSGRMVDGFFLNNQLTDFSFSPTERDGTPAANAVAPRKRPRSAMSPMIVLDRQGRLVAAAGSAGGPAIISYVIKTLIGALDWRLTMQSAISLPNLVAHGADFGAETDRFEPGLLSQLNTLGFHLQPGQFEESGLQGLKVLADGTLEGGVDPRREGVALGY
jgi:gamma-glutamyltranspeptidase/glutathione hydrolase